MTDLPDPLTTPDIDVRCFDGFLLNAERLLASELWALSTGEEFKAAVGLWCRAWKQLPGGSLPNDDRMLASFAGVTPARWSKVRTVALRGFVLCSDGRLYHQVLCQDAVRAFGKRVARHDQTAAATAARIAKRNAERNVDRDGKKDDDVTLSHRQGQGQRQGNRTPPPSSGVSSREDYEETTAATTADSSAPGETQPQTAAHRFRVVNTERIRRAVKDRDLPGILAGFAANPRYAEWPGAVIDMSLAAVVALLGWSVDQKFVVRAPSGFRKVREAWESLDPDERKRIGREQCQRYGVVLPAAPPQQAQEAAS